LEEDCKDEEGLFLSKEESESKIINEPLYERVIGRILAEGLKDPKTKKVVISKVL